MGVAISGMSIACVFLVFVTWAVVKLFGLID
jgi:hypothetical protein